MSAGTASLGIISAATFSNRTKATRAVCGIKAKFKSRGSNMHEIDAMLAAWERVCTAQDQQAKMTTLVRLRNACEKWIDRKRTKASSLADYRRQAVQEVLISVKSAFQFLQKKDHTSKGPLLVKKGLASGYKFEREQYVAGGKQSDPYAAGDIHGAASSGDIPVAFDQIPDVNAYTGYGDQFNLARVSYFNRAQRMSMMAYVEGGRYYEDGSLLNCSVEPDFGDNKFRCQAHMYAVDQHGNLFHKKITGFSGTFFNHSSFCAGKQIICAGTAVWINGELRFISNHSGHYKPAPPLLRQYLAMAAEEDVDLSNTCVVVTDGSRGEKVLKATTFLNNMRAADDWPHNDAKGVYLPVGGRLARVDEPG